MSIGYSNPYQIRLETVIAVSPLLGHRLENRAHIREAQDLELLDRWQESSTIPLKHAGQELSFVVAPLDILVSREKGKVQFHIIELNGTGIGGVSNVPDPSVAAMANSLRRVARSLWEPDSVLLLPISGKENDENPRLNRLIHEKLIFGEALVDGLADAGGESDLVTMSGVQRGLQRFRPGVATVVIGYMKELLDECELHRDGAVYLRGRRVVGAINDRFCLNLSSQFEGQINPQLFTPINRTYLAGGDKGVVYSLLDEFVTETNFESFPQRVHHAHAHNRKELVGTVLDWLEQGKRPVIKPHGTGVGHGIEFFLDPRESVGEIVKRIDQSIKLTEDYYGVTGGAFPYTVCEFIDADVIDAPRHAMDGHKYELRVVVYRDGMALKACPSIAKVSMNRFDAADAGRHNLINNITNTAVTKSVDGSEYMLPLCHRETLDLLRITDEEMAELCQAATQFVRFTIDEIPRLHNRLGGEQLKQDQLVQLAAH